MAQRALISSFKSRILLRSLQIISLSKSRTQWILKKISSNKYLLIELCQNNLRYNRKFQFLACFILNLPRQIQMQEAKEMRNQMQTKIINRESLVRNSEEDLLWKKLLATLKMGRLVSRETPLSRQHQSQLASNNSRPWVVPMGSQSHLTRSSADRPFQIVAACRLCLQIWPKTPLYMEGVWLHLAQPNSNHLSRRGCTLLQTLPRLTLDRDCLSIVHPRPNPTMKTGVIEVIRQRAVSNQ